MFALYFQAKMCGIFAYLNYLKPKTRKEVVEILLQGLRRMEYRGYDSAGIAIDAGESDETHAEVALYRKCGKVDNLEESIRGNLTYYFFIPEKNFWIGSGDSPSTPGIKTNRTNFELI